MAALALDQTFPQPHPLDVDAEGVGAATETDAAGGGVALRDSGFDAIDTLELVDSDRLIGVALALESREADCPTLTLSVLFLSVGVPDREMGRSICDA